MQARFQIISIRSLPTHCHLQSHLPSFQFGSSKSHGTRPRGARYACQQNSLARISHYGNYLAVTAISCCILSASGCSDFHAAKPAIRVWLNALARRTRMSLSPDEPKTNHSFSGNAMVQRSFWLLFPSYAYKSFLTALLGSLLKWHVPPPADRRSSIPRWKFACFWTVP